MDVSSIINGYDQKKLTVGVLGGHSALDVSHGAKKHGFKTLCVARKGREKTYDSYYRTKGQGPRAKGCIDDTILVDTFEDMLQKKTVEKLQKMNTIFVHNRYFWVYFPDFKKVEEEFAVPIFGSRHLLKLEERDQPYNQNHLLRDAGIRTPKMYKTPKDIDLGRMVIVKAREAQRKYERGFFLATATDFDDRVNAHIKSGMISPDAMDDATIEEFIVGAPVNFNFFYSPLTGELELLGTDTRRQTNLDGFLRMTAEDQMWAKQFMPVKMVETGHIAVTVKESILEKAFDLGEKFVAQCKKLPKKLDPTGKGIIGPFALQGAVVTEDGKEDIVIFDVSFRIPGSPGTFATPYTRYLFGEAMSVGERIGMELKAAVGEGRLGEVVT
ncbi:5-formaminoimidazole-4-carboxamide-1-(beta)-D-ribofuranosyl 5'-monophosphate synthetase [Candidatus Peribacteria bacterium RIFCSPHIGHO2_01_FULL_55_13]|nr:MAG: 5-formaminoimidazole-4-carboxamide-1-(beta)-D-ribofuranosyl 5'-monophosphate synthetase [Candidatus Peribacteria bacterium RIFCSPHIGHO2_01_FULL_55_13]OGJ65275.1 MAG: 5-formaminoimidazole-4-carboxamide-1-(beta)-D-ribofuranosyl 5'-monophosphate synthetase [Candidatus Peribacteria bacterium RIFCSPHIGHO2_12_FULL_55_11]